jgi:hypothetical protein
MATKTVIDDDSDLALTYDQLARDSATSEVAACRAASTNDVNAGGRFARSMLRMMHDVQGGDSTGPGDDECAPIAYDAMGIEIQKFMAAATHDASSTDFMHGFSMGLAVYLFPGLSGSILGGPTPDIDPVDVLCDAHICSSDVPGQGRPIHPDKALHQIEALDAERVDLTLKALHQIDSLLPIAQCQADRGGEPDLMLGLLGRIQQMNSVATELLLGSGERDDDNLIERNRVEVLGRREGALHG